MGRRTEKIPKSHTLPSSPTHPPTSSSSSDFEFTVSLSPRKSSAALCPADELFYRGQLLPLHLHSRLSMLRHIVLSASSSSSFSSDAATASRDSAASSTSTDSRPSFSGDFPDCHSSRPSSAVDDDELRRLQPHTHDEIKRAKYFSFSRFSSVFRKDAGAGGSPVQRVSATAREVIRKYLKKVKPLYKKLSQKQQQKMSPMPATATAAGLSSEKTDGSLKANNGGLLHSYSGNLRNYPRRKSCAATSCPSSRRSSPSHSGVLYQNGFSGTSTTSSSMEELQSAIQSAIAHCKNSMIQNKQGIIGNDICVN
ncbi:hypothetical protein NMG60_11029885 [Bertholletia excelsa]